MLSENGGSKVGGEMSRKRYTAEQIIGKLREAEVALSQGETAAQVCRTLGIAEQTFYR
jgi:putative transposase